jgi:pilus assembly protein CpaF
MTNSPIVPPRNPEILKLKNYLIGFISREMESRSVDDQNKQQVVTQLLDQAYLSTKLELPSALRDELFDEIIDELLGFGPIQAVLNDAEVSEVMVNGSQNVYIEKKGVVTKTNITFENDEQVLRLIDRIILPLGRRIDTDSPTVDARLPDGSRVNAVIPPVAIDGPTITIRKFMKDRLKVSELIAIGSINRGMAEFLRACVISRLNVIVSGGTGSGKTTLLNALSSFIPTSERIITIEDAAELQLQQSHVVRMETKPANVEGKNAIYVRDLVRNSLRMRPDRIIVGEVRGGEALDMLQAMNTGHDGSLTTLHANSPRDAISRLETLCLMSGMDLPLRSIREQIAAAIDLIVHVARLRDGSRKVTSISEVSGMEGETVVMTEIFRFEQVGVSQDGRVLGDLKATGIRPLFTPRLEIAGFRLGAEVFNSNLSNQAGTRRK